jgi:hypothetical protein
MRAIPTLGGALAAFALATAAHAQPPPVIPLPAPGSSTIYVAEELLTGPLPSEVIAKMGPLHTLAAIEDLLKAGRIPFSWRVGEISTDKIPPELTRQIAVLPRGEPFILPQGGAVLIAVILSARRE